MKKLNILVLAILLLAVPVAQSIAANSSATSVQEVYASFRFNSANWQSPERLVKANEMIEILNNTDWKKESKVEAQKSAAYLRKWVLNHGKAGDPAAINAESVCNEFAEAHFANLYEMETGKAYPERDRIWSGLRQNSVVVRAMVEMLLHKIENAPEANMRKFVKNTLLVCERKIAAIRFSANVKPVAQQCINASKRLLFSIMQEENKEEVMKKLEHLNSSYEKLKVSYMAMPANK